MVLSYFSSRQIVYHSLCTLPRVNLLRPVVTWPLHHRQQARQQQQVSLHHHRAVYRWSGSRVPSPPPSTCHAWVSISGRLTLTCQSYDDWGFHLMPVKREAVTTQLYFAEMHSFLYCYTRAYLWSPFIMMVWVYVLRDSVLFLVLSDFPVDVAKRESKAKSKSVNFQRRPDTYAVILFSSGSATNDSYVAAWK